MTPEVRQGLVLLNSLDGVGPKTIIKIKDHFPDVVSVFGSSIEFLRDTLGIHSSVCERIMSAARSDAAEKEIDYCDREKIKILALWDEGYPSLLKEIFDPPVILFVKGKLEPDPTAIAVVGARSSTQYGNQTAYRLSFQLALVGAALVSGLARGIDSNAHEGALAAKGVTWAVMGCGFRHFYPRENRKLADRILEQGCLISEFTSDVAPIGVNFPRRNRIISGVSKGVVIVEASKNSGSLITADFALEQGRPVMAVPGRIDVAQAAGTLQLIRDGAKMIQGVEDIFEEIGMKAIPVISGEKKEVDPDLLREEKLIMNALKEDVMGIDELGVVTKLSTQQLLTKLFSLELKRQIKPLPGKRYARMDVYRSLEKV